MDIGSLTSVINYKYPSGIKDVNIIATLMKICLETLVYLHDRKYMHRDVKSGNILLSKDGTIILGDFGIATKIKNNSKKKSFIGSLNWMPPEVLSNEGYDHKVIFYIIYHFVYIYIYFAFLKSLIFGH